MKKIATTFVIFMALLIGFESFINNIEPLPADRRSDFQQIERWLSGKKKQPDWPIQKEIVTGLSNNLTGLDLEMPLFYLEVYDQALRKKMDHVAVIFYPQAAVSQGNTPALFTFEYFFDFLKKNQRTVMVINGQNKKTSASNRNSPWESWRQQNKQWIKDILKRSEPDYLVIYQDRENIGSDEEVAGLIAELTLSSKQHQPQTQTFIELSHERAQKKEFLEKMAAEKSLDGIGVNFFHPGEEDTIRNTAAIWSELTDKPIWLIATWNGRDSYRQNYKKKQDEAWLETVFAMAAEYGFSGVVIQKPEYFFTYQENLSTPESIDQFIQKLK